MIERFLSNIPLKIIIFCVFDQSSTARLEDHKNCCKLQGLSFHISEVDDQDLLYEHQAKNVLRENISTPPFMGCLVQVGNGIELEAVGFQFEPYWWLPCGVTWDSSQVLNSRGNKAAANLSKVLQSRIMMYLA